MLKSGGPLPTERVIDPTLERKKKPAEQPPEVPLTIREYHAEYNAEVPAPDELQFRMARALLEVQARKRGGRGGQMMTAYTCAMCEDDFSAASTCTPLLCPMCEDDVRDIVRAGCEAMRAREGGR